MSSANLRLLAVKKENFLHRVAGGGVDFTSPFPLITPLTSLTMSIRTTDKFFKIFLGRNGKLVLETDYNHSLFRLLKDLRRWLFCQTGSAFHGSSSVGGSGQNRVSCRCDVGFVGRLRDRRWIQRSSVDPEIVGRSRDRRWIQRSSADLEVGEYRVSRQSFPSPRTCRRFGPTF